MNNRNATFATILLAFGVLALSSRTQAINPPPDGGYPGGNTAEGQNALLSLTTGTYDTAVGVFSLLSDTTGNFNTAVGAGTLLLNTGGSNTAIGAGALLSNVTGTDNTANGAFALFSNTATGNTAVGSRALLNNTTGGTLGNVQGQDVGPNVAVGQEALESNTVASSNTAVGYQALHDFTTGPVGSEQLGLCTAVGFQALGSATGGIANCGFGYRTLYSNTAGNVNTAVGHRALSANTEGNDNTAVGAGALIGNIIGSRNAVIGSRALENSTGTDNIAIGYAAGDSITRGNNNIFIGFGGNTDESDTMRIGSSQTATYIAGISDTTLAVGNQVIVGTDGRLGVATSSQRFKQDIKPMDRFSEVLFLLNPVAFHYKKGIDPRGTQQLGLVAEEVEKVNPDLVVRDKEGKAYSVHYDQVNAMLLNEFLKEHKKVQQLEVAVSQQRDQFEAQISELKKEIESVAARSKHEHQEIQKVKAQTDMKKGGPRIAANR